MSEQATLTAAQYEFLTRELDGRRVKQANGQAHLEAWDVRRHLIRVFGFGGFDVHTIRCELIERVEHPPQGQGGRPRWTVVYSADVRLTVKAADGSVLAVYEDGATGDAVNQPSLGDAHDQAKKTALSQALKRCAVNLGDQFGLSLYNDGKAERVVYRSLVRPEQADQSDQHALTEPAADDVHQGYDASDPRALRRRVDDLFVKAGIVRSEDRLRFCQALVSHHLESVRDLRAADWPAIIAGLEQAIAESKSVVTEAREAS